MPNFTRGFILGESKALKLVASTFLVLFPRNSF